ncbi:hypothetical protein AVEN_243068-1 [Araneus ventricosus]|uniref:Uncharacterized protein n=1 Tax=Araneus ventricosus TaxID=182803 RepID=A0A4Y2VX79_ARAVE|nr:hypothetical protein AVEN_243068-1 [Araneus ventricosus]
MPLETPCKTHGSIPVNLLHHAQRLCGRFPSLIQNFMYTRCPCGHQSTICTVTVAHSTMSLGTLTYHFWYSLWLCVQLHVVICWRVMELFLKLIDTIS